MSEDWESPSRNDYYWPPTIFNCRGQWFQKSVRTLDPQYEMPSRRTIMRKILPAKYEEVRESHKGNQPFNSLGHSHRYLDFMPEKVLDTHVFETFKFNKNHTADNIVKELKRVVNNWGIAQKVVFAVTDNASNMVAAIAKAGWQHVPCFTHTLNFIVKDSSDN